MSTIRMTNAPAVVLDSKKNTRRAWACLTYSHLATHVLTTPCRCQECSGAMCPTSAFLSGLVLHAIVIASQWYLIKAILAQFMGSELPPSSLDYELLPVRCLCSNNRTISRYQLALYVSYIYWLHQHVRSSLLSFDFKILIASGFKAAGPSPVLEA